MKKRKLLIPVLLLAALVSATWLIGYHSRKNNDNIPTKEQMVSYCQNKREDYAADILRGYKNTQLMEVWGKPDGSLFGFWGDIWETNTNYNLFVYYDRNGLVAHVKAASTTDSEPDTPNAQMPSIVYNGEIYCLTEKQIPAEVEESIYAGRIASTVPLSEMPTEEGQANFGEIGTPYAVTSDGFVVLWNNEWTVFEPQVHPMEPEDDKSTFHFGVNAVILEIDADQQQLTVKGTDSTLGEHCVISCENAELIYCHYESGDVLSITFHDLLVGDEITLNIKESEMQTYHERKDILKVDQLQLATQRLEPGIDPTAPA